MLSFIECVAVSVSWPITVNNFFFNKAAHNVLTVFSFLLLSFLCLSLVKKVTADLTSLLL